MKCSKCGHVWTEHPELEMDMDVEAGDWVQRVQEPPTRNKRAAKRGANRASSGEKRRGGAVMWILFLVLLVGIGGGAYWYRDLIMAKLPATEALYAAVGLGPESPFAGLDLIDVAWKQEETEGGAKILRITGKVVNKSTAPRDVPQLSGVLYDGKNKELYRWTFKAPEPRLLPREDVLFKTQVTNPDTKAARLTIQFSDPKTAKQ